MLSKARTMSGAMAINNSKISLFPDFFAELQKPHAKFIDVRKKKKLSDLNLQYAMLDPARLCVVALGEVHFCDRPTSAAQWLDQEDRALWAAKLQCPASTSNIATLSKWKGFCFSLQCYMVSDVGFYTFFSFPVVKADNGEHWNYLHRQLSNIHCWNKNPLTIQVFSLEFSLLPSHGGHMGTAYTSARLAESHVGSTPQFTFVVLTVFIPTYHCSNTLSSLTWMRSDPPLILVVVSPWKALYTIYFLSDYHATCDFAKCLDNREANQKK